MKQTFIRKKNVALCGGAAAAILLTCAVIAVILILEENYAFFIPLFFPTLLGLLLAAAALIEYRGSIELDEEKIKFNYRLFSRTGSPNRAGMEFYYSEIRSIRRTFRKGDGITGSDCFLYTISLADQRQFDTYLFHFGKEEDAIFNLIREKIPAAP